MLFRRQLSATVLEETERKLRQHVEMLAGVIGERSLVTHPGALEGTAKYIEQTLATEGYQPRGLPYRIGTDAVRNIEAEVAGTGRQERIWILGAHYDSAIGTPGADDNASAVAGVLEVARLLRDHRPRDTLRFVLFVNEEPPFYKGEQMGSLVYARACRARGDAIRGMINLEMIGCYSDVSGSQQLPALLNRRPWRWLFPTRGNFVAFVGDRSSGRLAWRLARAFRRSVRFPSRWLAAPANLEGIGMSDHWSFWEQEYPAVMVTDTAFFRYPHYHSPHDTADKLNYPAMAKVVAGLAGAVHRLVG